MLELAADLLPLLDAGEPVAAVTVTRVVRSAPRGPGATLAVTADMRVIGSISGGCVEGDAVMLALAALRTGVPATARFGFDDAADNALPAGLACGGAVEVLAYPIAAADAGVRAELAAAAAGRSARIGVVAGGPEAGRILTGPAVSRLVASRRAAPGARMLTSAYSGHDVLDLAVESRPRLIILGAGEHAASLCRVASAAGFAVTVCDAWGMLVTRARFPDAAELVVGLPHEYLAGIPADDLDERTAVCVLTHDERLDVPALRVALERPVGFVGAMGARPTVSRRAALLRQAGVADAALARLHSPLGLDLGGRTPEETAVSVIAEIITARNDGSLTSLRNRTGPVHRESAPASCGIPVASEEVHA